MTWRPGAPYFMDIGGPAPVEVPPDLGTPVFHVHTGELVAFATLKDCRSPAVVREILKGRQAQQARQHQPAEAGGERI